MMKPLFESSIARKLENIHKNRYPDILPFDHSLVTLDRSCNQYINANKIPIGCGKTVIATQGPLLHTIYDFWSMILLERPEEIVMLSPLIENGVSKCSPYWPRDLATETYICDPVCQRCKPIKVNCLFMETYSNFEVSALEVLREYDRHVVLHFFYTSWPNSTAPLVDDFLPFLNKIHDFKRQIVIHCSAGVGRTGTLTAILRCLETGSTPKESVEEIRKYRDKMVQTKEQYEFIHLIIDKLKHVTQN